MEGFILAAGLGTRLRPLTNDRPKALVEISGVTLLEHTIRTLTGAGISHIVVNPVDISDERSLLLDTGGGLKHAAPLFSGRDDILVHNVDILSNVDLRAVEAQHRAQRNLVTLCVSRRTTKRLLAFDAHGHLLGRADEGLAFSGISVVSPRLFPLLPEADHPYPVIDEYIRLSHEGHPVGAFIHPAEHWLDVGKPDTLEKAKQWTLSSDK